MAAKGVESENDPYAGLKTDKERQVKYQELLREYRQAEKERRKTIFDEGMRKWEAFGKTSYDMDARFDNLMRWVAGGSFGVSFTALNLFRPGFQVNYPIILLLSWAFFVVCLVVMSFGYLFSAKAYFKLQEEVVKNITRQYNGEEEQYVGSCDLVSPCNYISLIAYIGGIVCLLVFMAMNMQRYL